MLVGAAGMARFAAHPWVNLAIAAMFVAFALNFFGPLRDPAPCQPPRPPLPRHTGPGLERRPGGVLVGGTFAVTTFTCTAPFVGTLLVLASQGQWQQPVVGLLVFSATFAVPFVLLALVPSALTRLPRSADG